MGEMSRRVRAVIGVSGAVAGVGVPFVPTPVVSVPVGDVIAPAAALGIVRHILRIRSGQIRARTRPAVLTDSQVRTLSEIVDNAGSAGSATEFTDDAVLPARVTDLLAAVEQLQEEASVPVIDDWTLVVRMLGEPLVESRSGCPAGFGKKRSMELLSWMVLNRDRLSRSSARNAMWDVSVADSTFGTVLTDLRRGLSRIAPPPTEHGWCPATFSDRLVLAEGIVSDVELLAAAIHRQDTKGLITGLSRVRDVPLAGTSYLWADLDGSTTRMVITVLDAVDSLVEIAGASGDRESVLVGVRAGLRVLPGDERLLRIQRSLLSR